MVRFVDLFAGVGGIRIGFEQACHDLGINSECVFSSEIDPDACETYRLNFGERPSGDIKQYVDSIPDFDFLLAGFPCQPFSYAGKREGFGDTRGTLFFEIEKILQRNKPKGFLLENVRGLTTHDGGRTLATIIRALENLGYSVTYLLLNSSDFSAPQNRVRLYILGVLNEQIQISLLSDKGAADSHKFKNRAFEMPLFFPANGHTIYKVVRDILEARPHEKYNCSPDFIKRLGKAVDGDFNSLHGVRMIDYRGGNSLHSWDIGIKGECSNDERAFMNALIGNRRKKVFGTHQDGKSLSLEQIQTFYNHPALENVMQGLIKKGYLKCIDDKYKPVCGNMSFEVFKFLDPDSISITLTTADSHKLGIVQNGLPRRITPRECARLQGFPEEFILNPNDTAAYRQFGNSVTVPVVKAVLTDLFENNSDALLKSASTKKKPSTQNKKAEEMPMQVVA